MIVRTPTPTDHPLHRHDESDPHRCDSHCCPEQGSISTEEYLSVDVSRSNKIHGRRVRGKAMVKTLGFRVADVVLVVDSPGKNTMHHSERNLPKLKSVGRLPIWPALVPTQPPAAPKFLPSSKRTAAPTKSLNFQHASSAIQTKC
jgi:hypothetical protein